MQVSAIVRQIAGSDELANFVEVLHGACQTTPIGKMIVFVGPTRVGKSLLLKIFEKGFPDDQIVFHSTNLLNSTKRRVRNVVSKRNNFFFGDELSESEMDWEWIEEQVKDRNFLAGFNRKMTDFGDCLLQIPLRGGFSTVYNVLEDISDEEFLEWATLCREKFTEQKWTTIPEEVTQFNPTVLIGSRE